VLRRDIDKDGVISFDDVRLPATRLSDQLWREQRQKWPYGTVDSRKSGTQ
jgi:predicted homoserine dehydrogenase-like protein